MEFWAVIALQTGQKVFPSENKFKKIICVSVCLSSPRNPVFYNLGKKLYEV